MYTGIDMQWNAVSITTDCNVILSSFLLAIDICLIMKKWIEIETLNPYFFLLLCGMEKKVGREREAKKDVSKIQS